MNPTTNQFSLIFDQIYNEKHANFSKMISKWHNDKEQFMMNSYKQSIQRMFDEIEADHKIFERRITQLLRVANAQYQILSKVKSINNNNQDNKQPLRINSPTNLSTDQTQMFQSIIHKINKKSIHIHQMSQFASRFFAITSTELNEFKSMTTEIYNRRERYVFDYKKQSVQDTKVLSELCLKSQSKYFKVRLLERLRELFEKQVKILSKVNSDVRECYKGSLNKRKQVLQNCIDNMTKYQQLLVKVFCDNMIGDVSKYFSTLVVQMDKLIKENEIEQKQYLGVKQQVDKQFQALFQDNVQIFNFIMEDITLGEWRNTKLQVMKKSSFGSFSPMNFSSSHRSLKQDSIHDDSNKQFSIAPTNKSIPSSSQPTQNQIILTLTIDYKLLFRKLSQRNKIFKQYMLNDLKQKTQNQKKKVFDVRTLVFKDKSSKQTLQICFMDGDKREQFLLHIERYEQLRDTLGK